jgi:uncharacterized protein (DUF1330 family)
VTDAAERYYQLVLIWVRDAEMFQEYLRLLPPVVGRYGGTADRSIEPTAIRADGLACPQIINLVHYDSERAYEGFTTDPDFAAIEPLRSRSVDLLSFGGRLVQADPSPTDLGERVYTIELATFRDGSPAAYRRYETDGESAMRRYGYQTEYTVALRHAPGTPRRPDLAKVSYFPDAAAKSGFEADPVHARIEDDLYPAAVTDPIRITGRVHPATLR